MFYFTAKRNEVPENSELTYCRENCSGHNKNCVNYLGVNCFEEELEEKIFRA